MSLSDKIHNCGEEGLATSDTCDQFIYQTFIRELRSLKLQLNDPRLNMFQSFTFITDRDYQALYVTEPMSDNIQCCKLKVTFKHVCEKDAIQRLPMTSSIPKSLSHSVQSRANFDLSFQEKDRLKKQSQKRRESLINQLN